MSYREGAAPIRPLYVTHIGKVTAFCITSGKKLWSHSAGSMLDVPRMAADATRLFVLAREHLVALDGRSGQGIWRVPVDPELLDHGTTMELRHERLLVRAGARLRVYCAATGALVLDVLASGVAVAEAEADP